MDPVVKSIHWFCFGGWGRNSYRDLFVKRTRPLFQGRGLHSNSFVVAVVVVILPSRQMAH